MRMAPVTTASQPTMVMTTRQSGVHTFVGQHDGEAGRQGDDAGKEDEAGLAMNSLAKARNFRALDRER